jgi:hypothetical protein
MRRPVGDDRRAMLWLALMFAGIVFLCLLALLAAILAVGG